MYINSYYNKFNIFEETMSLFDLNALSIYTTLCLQRSNEELKFQFLIYNIRIINCNICHR